MSIVLVADDDPTSLDLLQYMLTGAGYQVLRARDGEESMRLARTGHASVIILDVHMPHINGGDACLLIKNDPALQATPVFLISADDEVRDPTYIARVKADRTFAKPFSREELLRAVDDVINA